MPFIELQVVFWIAAVVVLYAYAAYPLLLIIAVRLRPAAKILKRSVTPSVSVIIVAHNEEKHIESKILNCLNLDYPKKRMEILVASDGSRDATERIISKFECRGVRLVSLPGPRGKAIALNRAIPESRGEILVLCDARQQLAPDALRQLASNFADPSVGAVSGELHIRHHPGSPTEGVGLYWKYEKLIRRTECRLDSTVGATGAIYALRRELYRPLDPRTILDDVAIPMEVVLAGYRVIFDSLALAYDEGEDDVGREYQRKVRTLAGNYQLIFLRPDYLDPLKNRILWQFVSHKLARLLVPWCLLALLISSALISYDGSTFFRAAFLCQVAFYTMATAGWFQERLSFRLKILSFPYAFTMLNLAAAAGLFGYLLGTERAAWRGVTS